MCAKNYKIIFTFVEVIQKKSADSFFQTWCKVPRQAVMLYTTVFCCPCTLVDLQASFEDVFVRNIVPFYNSVFFVC